MTLRELISRAKALRTLHEDTFPGPGTEARRAWEAERELLNRFITDATTRLNESREVRS